MIEPNVSQFSFDGHVFPEPAFSAASVVFLYIAKKARDGEQDAIAFAKAVGLKITDASGAVYYDAKAKPTDVGGGGE